MNSQMTQMQLMSDTSMTNDSAKRRSSSWFEAMAEAWGEALDEQASRIQEKSDEVAAGFETPAQITELTAESLRMGYLSNSSHTSLTSVGSALETLARKQ